MSKSELEIKTTIQIQKPVDEVFEAIVNPEKMCNYFISYSSGRMEENKDIFWKFPELDDQFPIRVVKIEKNNYVSFKWDNDDKELLVEIQLKGISDDSTLVTVSEKGMQNDESGIKWLKSNTEGWANFLACLKAYLEYRINLRKGAFDFMKKPDL